ncbi:EpsD family peptidyl-prolyl cis-trans isomerase [Uliginosibacterium sp. sgz301328]|uniref:EpsD family peptidyl-prolyl cis-trans isomerase n=1 Tax=Uliginosibacterium sp. sgz301328 TaxID=3243764 RepID=UPI00359CC061
MLNEHIDCLAPNGSTRAGPPQRAIGKPVIGLVAGACAVLACACSRPAAVADGSTQAAATIATVNGDPITRDRFIDALGDPSAPQGDPAQAGKVLDRLIDEQIVVQRAIEKKVDRDPQVAREMDAARRDILRRAYLEDISNDIKAPSRQEVRQYYQQHPDLFSRRRIYSFRVLNLPGMRERAAEIQGQVARARGLPDLMPWLQHNGMEFVDSATQKPAELIPMDALPRLARMRDGQLAVTVDGDDVEIVQLSSSRVEPLDLATATPLITQYLTNQRRLERAEQEVNELRASARIEKLGEFARSTTAGAASPLIVAARGASAADSFDGQRHVASE